MNKLREYFAIHYSMKQITIVFSLITPSQHNMLILYEITTVKRQYKICSINKNKINTTKTNVYEV